MRDCRGQNPIPDFSLPDVVGKRSGPGAQGQGDTGNPPPPATVTRAACILAGAARLRAAGIDSPRLEARLLLAHALGLTTNDLLRDSATPVPPAALACYQRVLARRSAREPLAYILGHREFWSLDFAVSPATLIPRPDSETLIAAARTVFTGRAPPARILDLGTGTGCLLLAALAEFPAAFGVGVDRVEAAAHLAAANAAALGLASRSVFLVGNWADPLNACFDLVLCNPPYIPTCGLRALMPEVAEHEPTSALDGGSDGLGAYHAIIPSLPGLLSPDGVAVLELGVGQAPVVTTIAGRAGLASETRDDLAGIARVLVLRSVLP